MIRHRGLNVAHILHALEDRLVDGKDEDGGLEFPKVDSDEDADYVVTFAHGLEVDRVQHQLSPSLHPRQVLIIYNKKSWNYLMYCKCLPMSTVSRVQRSFLQFSIVGHH